MTVILQSITRKIDRDYQVGLTIDSRNYSFTVTVQAGGIFVGEKELQAVNGDDLFDSVFKFDSRMATKIERIVGNWHDGIMVDLPMDLGNIEQLNKRLPH